jgi:hypothetical protein
MSGFRISDPASRVMDIGKSRNFDGVEKTGTWSSYTPNFEEFSEIVG